jgi:hypothetical protein
VWYPGNQSTEMNVTSDTFCISYDKFYRENYFRINMFPFYGALKVISTEVVTRVAMGYRGLTNGIHAELQ